MSQRASKLKGNLMMQRRILLHALAALTAVGVTPHLAAQTKPAVEVWKDPNCGCCKDWVVYLQANGFSVKVHDTGNTEARARLGIPVALGSCHTAAVGGYAIEGHVPAADIHRLLREKSKAAGLAVPGMPVGSPGMDGPIYGARKDAYQVMLVLQDGNTRVFNTYPSTSSTPSTASKKETT
jgi:hypothetical protein